MIPNFFFLFFSMGNSSELALSCDTFPLQCQPFSTENCKKMSDQLEQGLVTQPVDQIQSMELEGFAYACAHAEAR